MNQPVSSPSPDPLHQALIEALRERLRIIGDRESYQRDGQAHLRQLQTVSERIVALQTELPRPVDPTLAHYFERCSYDKVLAWLEAADKSGLRHH